MSYDGNGNYLVPAGTQGVSGQVIESSKYNALLADLQTSLSKAFLRDGQSAALANLSMGGFKLQNLASGSARSDAIPMSQVQDGTVSLLTSVAGVDTITASLTTPSLTAYATGMEVRLTATGNNTGAATLNINALGAKSIVTQQLGALPAGAMVAGGIYRLVYDGTRWQIGASSMGSGGGAAAGANSDITSLLALTSPIAEVRQIQPISASVAGNALTISASALSLEFRSATLASGAVSFVEGTPANLVISSGSTLGTVNAVQSRIVVLALNNAGTIELAAVNIAGGNDLTETGVISTTAEGGAGAADSASVIYSTTARTNVAYRVIGYIESTQVTAGTWTTAPSTIQGMGGEALAAMSSLGYSQTVQNVTVGRALSTTYYNTTGKPIFVAFTASVSSIGSAARISIAGNLHVGASAYIASASSSVCGIVPPGIAYSCDIPGGGSITSWLETR